jgi:hypothetical protein
MFSKSLIGMATGVLALAVAWTAPAAATPVNGTLTINSTGSIQFVPTGGTSVATYTGLSFAPSSHAFNASGGSGDLAVFTGTSGSISDFTYLPTFSPLASFVIISGGTILTFDLASVTPIGTTNGWLQSINSESGTFNLKLDGTLKVTGFDDTEATILLSGTQILFRNANQVIISRADSWSGTLISSGTPVRTPEPATLALIGAGLAGMGALRRRKAH